MGSAQCTVHCYLTGDAKPSEGSRHFTMVLDSPLPQFGPIWRKKSLSGRHFFLVRATMNIKPVLKSSWTKLKHRRCTKRPGELKHINILVLKKSILKKQKKHGNKKVANFVHLTFSSTPNRAFK